jgi:hypothetical protein
MRNRTEHGFSWLTAISDAGSTPAASTIISQRFRTYWLRIVQQVEQPSQLRVARPGPIGKS